MFSSLDIKLLIALFGFRLNLPSQFERSSSNHSYRYACSNDRPSFLGMLSLKPNIYKPFGLTPDMIGIRIIDQISSPTCCVLRGYQPPYTLGKPQGLRMAGNRQTAGERHVAGRYCSPYSDLSSDLSSDLGSALTSGAAD